MIFLIFDLLRYFQHYSERFEKQLVTEKNNKTIIYQKDISK